MFWDAQTAKKGLAKGYEQLAIWVGDAEMGCENLQTELESDSEWELCK
ncbi:hypothetical protein SLEP1_g4943 [Rubroshorea leprosula]|uniref:Uncharacterized protein n=1 Tax=Rubroshorea leprosula TaxID=152421 RepID=A0AAV5HQD8_9ROSI|nr:hypothetical protein SLEP1_g4943 [Rubroshorea leprosula]